MLEIQNDAKVSAEEHGKVIMKTERDRVVDLVKIQFGDESGDSFGKLVHSDITPELFKATKKLTVVENPDEGDSKDDILEALRDTSAENPGADGKPDPADKDYMAVCREYQLKYKCSLLVAQREVSRLNPDLRKNYIKAVNQ